MAIGNEEILRLAALSRLALTVEEISRLSGEIPAILEYVGKLSQVDTEGVEPYENILIEAETLREDAVQESSKETQAALRAAFPEQINGLLKVKSVFSARDKKCG